MLFILQDDVVGGSSAFLRLFVTNQDIDGAEGVALSWVLTGIVIAAICTAVMAGGKWLLKERAHLGCKHWPLPKVFGWLLLGWLLILLVLGLIYYFSIDFTMILAIGGYFKGVIFTALVYAVVMIVVDLIIPRFRSDYGW
jgi:polyferredoxin